MSFWCTKKWFLTIGTTSEDHFYLGNHPEFDTYEEAMAYMHEFNGSRTHKDRVDEFDIIRDMPQLNPRHYADRQFGSVVMDEQVKIDELDSKINRVVNVLKDTRHCEIPEVMELWDKVLAALEDE